jgi:hypothetical protein
LVVNILKNKVELIEADAELEEELEEFERTFKKDENLKIWFIIRKNCVINFFNKNTLISYHKS